MTDETPMTKDQLAKLLDAAIDKGVALGRAEAVAEAGEQAARFQFSNGQSGAPRGDQSEFEDALAAKAFQLRGKGVRRIAKHAEIQEIYARFGRV